jgi:putative Mn2+ efflux pump MntP
MLRAAAGAEGSLPREALAGWALIAAAGATSVDALAAGTTLPTLELPVLLACAVIGGATACLCAAGTWVGGLAGRRVGKCAEMAGGLVLIGLGLKIFVDHQFLGA